MVCAPIFLPNILTNRPQNVPNSKYVYEYEARFGHIFQVFHFKFSQPQYLILFILTLDLTVCTNSTRCNAVSLQVLQITPDEGALNGLNISLMVHPLLNYNMSNGAIKHFAFNSYQKFLSISIPLLTYF